MPNMNSLSVRFFACSLGLISVVFADAQTAATEVYTDYEGFWASSSTSLSATRPDDHHHLLAFTIGEVTFSTGVNDDALDANSVTYTAAEFEALQISGLPSSGPGYLVFLGAAIDGDDTGAGTFTAPADSTEIAAYLMDGTKGLDFGTGIANVVTNEYEFSVYNLDPDAIGDGTPDMVFTQMAEVNALNDSICFLDEDGNLVGTKEAINWSGIDKVGNWTADFYRMDGTSHSTNVNKPIRVAGLDFTDVALTAGNIASVAAIRIEWGGASDPAFVGKNSNSFGTACEGLTFSGVSVQSAASSPAAPDGVVMASISNGNEPYALVSVLTGDTLSVAEWNTIPSGRYVFKALDDSDCLSTNSFTVSIPNRSCN